jgi:hypothetical protein
MFAVPPVANSPQLRFSVDAPSESPEKVIPLTFAAGVISFPLALKVSVPVVFADATGSAITLPAVAVAPVIVSTPPVLVTVTPVIPAAVNCGIQRCHVAGRRRPRCANRFAGSHCGRSDGSRAGALGPGNRQIRSRIHRLSRAEAIAHLAGDGRIRP